MSRTNTIRESVNMTMSSIAKFVIQSVYTMYFVISTIYYSIINLIYNRITLDCDVYRRERVKKTKFTETKCIETIIDEDEDEDEETDLISSIILELNQICIQSNHNITENNYYETNTNIDATHVDETNVETGNNGTAINLYDIIDDLFEYVKGVFHWSTHSQSFIARHIRVICGLYMFATVFCILYDFANHYEQLFYKITQSQ